MWYVCVTCMHAVFVVYDLYNANNNEFITCQAKNLAERIPHF